MRWLALFGLGPLARSFRFRTPDVGEPLRPALPAVGECRALEVVVLGLAGEAADLGDGRTQRLRAAPLAACPGDLGQGELGKILEPVLGDPAADRNRFVGGGEMAEQLADLVSNGETV